MTKMEESNCFTNRRTRHLNSSIFKGKMHFVFLLYLLAKPAMPSEDFTYACIMRYMILNKLL
jgi:hypothetical protein